ncbi:MAG: Modification methyltransferase [Candidatus Woesebacteria bacterium GW2011_GWC2_31_9]|uniref:site-specific DNA-methyltransferase (adenine-specific) n=1 Tax=Candidatus Woesebacteria bacterium GW2011_GWC2_31_9 TaxID=1618586 RepID=A0A0G0AZ04_9BACT|nr:MAG: Modification methyltransferase [Candidatus Woesebacteria bacterium GW2011_GWC2_31_9]
MQKPLLEQTKKDEGIVMQLIKYATQEKLRGGFYTPSQIAKFILKWAVNGNENYDVLEPSCGDGVFLEQIKKNNFEYKSITAIEIEEDEAEKASKLYLEKTKVLNEDFLTYCNSTEDRFDLVIGNPPYIRYQYFNKEQRAEAEKIFTRADLKYSKLTNAWVSFVVGSTLLLKENGKIGFVLPAELLQVSYAKQLRNFLAHFYNKINIVSFKKLVFPYIQQEVVLLLCEKGGNGDHLIEHLELKDASELEELDITKLKSPKKIIDFKSNKWTFYFLSQREINFIEKLLNQKEIQPLRHYANVEVGITTGTNEFFTISKEIAEQFHLQDYTKKMVGRSVQVPSVIFTEQDWKENAKAGVRAYFLKFPQMKELQKNKKAIDYIKAGEGKKINKLYKCRIRDEWQIVPSTWVSDALFIRRNNIYPKLIINEAKAYTTDTMHRVTIKKDIKLLSEKKVNINALVASYYNSLSLAFAEICGRSHGGGALELMPNEVESILLPYREENAELLDKIDSMMREGKNINEILEFTDKKILKEGYGFSDEEIKLANNIWKKLLNRRLGRN